MKPIHIEAEKQDIAEVVLMPGDPLRAKYIAENFLTDVKLINEIRNMLAYQVWVYILMNYIIFMM